MELTLHRQKSYFFPFMFQGIKWRQNDLQKYRRQYFGRRKTSERRKQANGGRRAKIGGPTRPLYLATWDPPKWPSKLRCRRSSSPWLRLDLKPTIKIVPRGVSRGGGGETQNQETGDRRLPPGKIEGGKRCRSHLRKAPPSPLRKSPSTPLSPWWRGSSLPPGLGFVVVTHVSLLSLIFTN